MDTHTLTKQVKQKANELGFSLAGVTSADPPAHMDVFQRWLKAGRHATMGYLATDQSVKRRSDPKTILPECRSVLVLGIPYNNPTSVPKSDFMDGYGRVAAYAWGEDYHDVLTPRLRAIVEYIEEQVGSAVANRWYTDSGPLLERELAQRAGLGWIGKNSMLINPQGGSYYLLAEILLGIELEVDEPIGTDHCGTCTRCIEACPTNCILEDRTLDASRCISYLSIEFKGHVAPELRPQMEDWIFGCDICQEVCPWNQRFAEPEGDLSLRPQEISPYANLENELQLSPKEFTRKFKGSPVKRAKRRGFLRNIAIAIGNSGRARNVPALARSLKEEMEPLIRGHVAWALGRIGGVAARQALIEASQQEQDEWVMSEIKAALAETR